MNTTPPVAKKQQPAYDHEQHTKRHTNRHRGRPDDYVAKPDFRILDIIARICVKHDKLYCYPSAQTLIELIFKFTGRTISRRSIWRHLGALERDGWIKTQSRHITNAIGGLELHSNLYVITKRTLKWCRALGTKLWTFRTDLLKSLIDIAVPIVAQTLTQESQLSTRRRRSRPPNRWATR